MNSLNVNKNNLNNKRLSRLQGVTLKVLAASYPGGFPKRALSQIVGRLYGNQSCITWNEKKTQADKLFSMGDLKSQVGALDLQMQVTRAIPLGRDTWLTPKFSVSYSRSIKALLNQRLVTYMPTTHSVWAVFITNQGITRIQNRKVKVNAIFWDSFQASLKDNQRSDQ